jgi:hypothetical protein
MRWGCQTGGNYERKTTGRGRWAGRLWATGDDAHYRIDTVRRSGIEQINPFTFPDV